jgi:hypothetical protein
MRAFQKGNVILRNVLPINRLFIKIKLKNFGVIVVTSLLIYNH